MTNPRQHTLDQLVLDSQYQLNPHDETLWVTLKDTRRARTRFNTLKELENSTDVRLFQENPTTYFQTEMRKALRDPNGHFANSWVLRLRPSHLFYPFMECIITPQLNIIGRYLPVAQKGSDWNIHASTETQLHRAPLQVEYQLDQDPNGVLSNAIRPLNNLFSPIRRELQFDVIEKGPNNPYGVHYARLRKNPRDNNILCKHVPFHLTTQSSSDEILFYINKHTYHDNAFGSAIVGTRAQEDNLLNRRILINGEVRLFEDSSRPTTEYRAVVGAMSRIDNNRNSRNVYYTISDSTRVKNTDDALLTMGINLHEYVPLAQNTSWVNKYFMDYYHPNHKKTWGYHSHANLDRREPPLRGKHPKSYAWYRTEWEKRLNHARSQGKQEWELYYKVDFNEVHYLHDVIRGRNDNDMDFEGFPLYAVRKADNVPMDGEYPTASIWDLFKTQAEWDVFEAELSRPKYDIAGFALEGDITLRGLPVTVCFPATGLSSRGLPVMSLNAEAEFEGIRDNINQYRDSMLRDSSVEALNFYLGGAVLRKAFEAEDEAIADKYMKVFNEDFRGEMNKYTINEFGVLLRGQEEMGSLMGLTPVYIDTETYRSSNLSFVNDKFLKMNLNYYGAGAGLQQPAIDEINRGRDTLLGYDRQNREQDPVNVEQYDNLVDNYYVFYGGASHTDHDNGTDKLKRLTYATIYPFAFTYANDSYDSYISNVGVYRSRSRRIDLSDYSVVLAQRQGIYNAGNFYYDKTEANVRSLKRMFTSGSAHQVNDRESEEYQPYPIYGCFQPRSLLFGLLTNDPRDVGSTKRQLFYKPIPTTRTTSGNPLKYIDPVGLYNDAMNDFMYHSPFGSDQERYQFSLKRPYIRVFVDSQDETKYIEVPMMLSGMVYAYPGPSRTFDGTNALVPIMPFDQVVDINGQSYSPANTLFAQGNNKSNLYPSHQLSHCVVALKPRPSKDGLGILASTRRQLYHFRGDPSMMWTFGTMDVAYWKRTLKKYNKHPQITDGMIDNYLSQYTDESIPDIYTDVTYFHVERSEWWLEYMFNQGYPTNMIAAMARSLTDAPWSSGEYQYKQGVLPPEVYSPFATYPLYADLERWFRTKEPENIMELFLGEMENSEKINIFGFNKGPHNGVFDDIIGSYICKNAMEKFFQDPIMRSKYLEATDEFTFEPDFIKVNTTDDQYITGANKGSLLYSTYARFLYLPQSLKQGAYVDSRGTVIPTTGIFNKTKKYFDQPSMNQTGIMFDYGGASSNPPKTKKYVNLQGRLVNGDPMDDDTPFYGDLSIFTNNTVWNQSDSNVSSPDVTALNAMNLTRTYLRMFPVKTNVLKMCRYYLEPYLYAAVPEARYLSNQQIDDIMFGRVMPGINVSSKDFYKTYPATESGIQSLLQTFRNNASKIVKKPRSSLSNINKHTFVLDAERRDTMMKDYRRTNANRHAFVLPPGNTDAIVSTVRLSNEAFEMLYHRGEHAQYGFDFETSQGGSGLGITDIDVLPGTDNRFKDYTTKHPTMYTTTMSSNPSENQWGFSNASYTGTRSDLYGRIAWYTRFIDMKGLSVYDLIYTLYRNVADIDGNRYSDIYGKDIFMKAIMKVDVTREPDTRNAILYYNSLRTTHEHNINFLERLREATIRRLTSELINDEVAVPYVAHSSAPLYTGITNNRSRVNKHTDEKWGNRTSTGSARNVSPLIWLFRFKCVRRRDYVPAPPRLVRTYSQSNHELRWEFGQKLGKQVSDEKGSFWLAPSEIGSYLDDNGKNNPAFRHLHVLKERLPDAKIYTWVPDIPDTTKEIFVSNLGNRFLTDIKDEDYSSTMRNAFPYVYGSKKRAASTFSDLEVAMANMQHPLTIALGPYLALPPFLYYQLVKMAEEPIALTGAKVFDSEDVSNLITPIHGYPLAPSFIANGTRYHLFDLYWHHRMMKQPLYQPLMNRPVLAKDTTLPRQHIRQWWLPPTIERDKWNVVDNNGRNPLTVPETLSFDQPFNDRVYTAVSSGAPYQPVNLVEFETPDNKTLGSSHNGGDTIWYDENKKEGKQYVPRIVTAGYTVPQSTSCLFARGDGGIRVPGKYKAGSNAGLEDISPMGTDAQLYSERSVNVISHLPTNTIRNPALPGYYDGWGIGTSYYSGRQYDSFIINQYDQQTGAMFWLMTSNNVKKVGKAYHPDFALNIVFRLQDTTGANPFRLGGKAFFLIESPVDSENMTYYTLGNSYFDESVARFRCDQNAMFDQRTHLVTDDKELRYITKSVLDSIREKDTTHTLNPSVTGVKPYQYNASTIPAWVDHGFIAHHLSTTQHVPKLSSDGRMVDMGRYYRNRLYYYRHNTRWLFETEMNHLFDYIPGHVPLKQWTSILGSFASNLNPHDYSGSNEYDIMFSGQHSWGTPNIGRMEYYNRKLKKILPDFLKHYIPNTTPEHAWNGNSFGLVVEDVAILHTIISIYMATDPMIPNLLRAPENVVIERFLIDAIKEEISEQFGNQVWFGVATREVIDYIHNRLRALSGIYPPYECDLTPFHASTLRMILDHNGNGDTPDGWSTVDDIVGEFTHQQFDMGPATIEFVEELEKFWVMKLPDGQLCVHWTAAGWIKRMIEVSTMLDIEYRIDKNDDTADPFELAWQRLGRIGINGEFSHPEHSNDGPDGLIFPFGTPWENMNVLLSNGYHYTSMVYPSFKNSTFTKGAEFFILNKKVTLIQDGREISLNLYTDNIVQYLAEIPLPKIGIFDWKDGLFNAASPMVDI